MKTTIRKNVKKCRILSLLLTLILVCGILPQTAFAAAEQNTAQEKTYNAASALPAANQVKAILDKIAKYQFATVPNPTIDEDAGNEWTVFALARGGYITDVYIWKYIANLTAHVKKMKGVLSKNKYTEYSRVIIALSSIGIDPHNIAGYDLVAPLAEYENVIKQGVNGPAFALIALDTKNYAEPTLPAGSSYTQTTRENLINYLITHRCSGGGWNVAGNANANADPDMTAMVIQALAPYYDDANPNLKVVVDVALAYLSSVQNATTAGFGTSGSEADAAVITALNLMNIPIGDSRFVKNNKSLYDDLMTYYISDKGAFKHITAGNANAMATDKAMAALVSIHRSLTGAKTLYDMSDVPAYTKTAPKVAKTSIKKLKAGKRSFTLTWKKNSKAKGYEVQYGTDKKFKKNVKTKPIKKNGTVKFVAKKLAVKKTYYVKIRCYVEVSKTKFYSGWSTVKNIKIKA